MFIRNVSSQNTNQQPFYRSDFGWKLRIAYVIKLIDEALERFKNDYYEHKKQSNQLMKGFTESELKRAIVSSNKEMSTYFEPLQKFVSSFSNLAFNGSKLILFFDIHQKLSELKSKTLASFESRENVITQFKDFQQWCVAQYKSRTPMVRLNFNDYFDQRLDKANKEIEEFITFLVNDYKITNQRFNLEFIKSHMKVSYYEPESSSVTALIQKMIKERREDDRTRNVSIKSAKVLTDKIRDIFYLNFLKSYQNHKLGSLPESDQLKYQLTRERIKTAYHLYHSKTSPLATNQNTKRALDFDDNALRSRNNNSQSENDINKIFETSKLVNHALQVFSDLKLVHYCKTLIAVSDFLNDSNELDRTYRSYSVADSFLSSLSKLIEKINSLLTEYLYISMGDTYTDFYETYLGDLKTMQQSYQNVLAAYENSLDADNNKELKIELLLDWLKRSNGNVSIDDIKYLDRSYREREHLNNKKSQTIIADEAGTEKYDLLHLSKKEVLEKTRSLLVKVYESNFSLEAMMAFYHAQHHRLNMVIKSKGQASDPTTFTRRFEFSLFKMPSLLEVAKRDVSDLSLDNLCIELMREPSPPSSRIGGFKPRVN